MKKISIVGCGNPVRGDDGVGPRLIRYLWELGVPPNINLVDGGTSGIDVIFHIKDSKKVIFIDACFSGEKPGTIYKVPADEIKELPSNEEANLHSIKWFHAIALANHILENEIPKDIEVFLIEGKNFEIGEELSKEVEESMKNLANYIINHYGIETMGTFEIELKEDGYMIIPNDIAEKYFSTSMTAIVIPKGMQFTIIPLSNDKQGGLLLKKINSKGDRALLIWEMLPPGIKYGKKKAIWSEEEGGLVVSLV